jgi:hypothetical protein
MLYEYNKDTKYIPQYLELLKTILSSKERNETQIRSFVKYWQFLVYYIWKWWLCINKEMKANVMMWKQ